MQTFQNPPGEPAAPTPVMVAAELQDALLVALRDLQRLEGLLDHASHNLLERFEEANAQLMHPDLAGSPKADAAREALHHAVIELQFHDMSSQLIAHIASTLQDCAANTTGDGQNGAMDARKPNPVTQSEMDAGSVELF